MKLAQSNLQIIYITEYEAIFWIISILVVIDASFQMGDREKDGKKEGEKNKRFEIKL